MSKHNYHRVVGIDLGTTCSAVGVFDRYVGDARVVPNHVGPLAPLTTPSVISLDKVTNKVIVGRPAESNLSNAPLNTIIEIKREMGEFFRETTNDTHGNIDKFNAREFYQRERAKAQQRGENPYEIPFRARLGPGEDTKSWFRPQELSAFILMKMKELAEKAIGNEIINAVITVPAYFTENQKRATKEAALLAGLYPLQLVPEPTAAAICYGFDELEPTRKVYLIYDLGGGTFDVSIISVEEARIEVLATSGNPRLGGADFDDAITEWVVAELKQHYGLDVGNDPQKRSLIKFEAEKVKIDLSSFSRAKLNLARLWPDNPPLLELTREKFVSLIDALLTQSLAFVEVALNAAKRDKGVDRDQVDAILLLGGSSKIPHVQQRLLDYFQKGHEFIRSDLDPETVVVRGAAILASRYEPFLGPFDITRKLDNVLLSTEADQADIVHLITEHSLSIGVQENLVSRIVDQGTNIPVSVTKGGYTNQDFAPEIHMVVYQGEGKFKHQNTPIGTLRIEGVDPKPATTYQFEVTFALDKNGLLTMTVFHKNTNQTHQAKFDQKTGVPENDMTTVRARLLEMYASGPASVAMPAWPRLPAGPLASPPPAVQAASVRAAAHEAPSPHVPAIAFDCVHFSVTSPTSVQPAATFILDVWAHLEQQRKLVLERAQQQQGGRDILMQSKGPVSVARGTILTVRLRIEGLQVPDPEDTILWHSEIGNARFQINVPQDAAPGERAGVAGIYADGLRIAKLYFSIPVTEHAGATATIPLKHDRHQRAFASYASEDRDQVLGRLQGMQKRTPSLEIFLDVLALRSGQNWEQELYREISRSDVFYLFWSNYARNSEWVDREWHCALERRGIDFIDPVPLVDPKVVPPPPELASKHFNDWVLAFLSPLNGVPPVS